MKWDMDSSVLQRNFAVPFRAPLSTSLGFPVRSTASAWRTRYSFIRLPETGG